jgi:hypothetical protein
VGELCGSGGAGLALLSEILGGTEEARIVIASLEILAAEFAVSVEAALET